MPNLKEVRNRIASVSSTKQITGAMKMVSASKLRKAQTAVLKIRPYSAKLTNIIQDITAEESMITPYAEIRHKIHVLLIVVTSNKGLCGSFNMNVIKETCNRIKEYNAIDKYCKISLFCIGKRGAEFFQKGNYNIAGVDNSIFDSLHYEESVAITENLLADFTGKKYDCIEIIYNRFKNSSTQIVTNEPFLPVISENPTNFFVGKDYIFEPSKSEIIENLVPMALKMQFYKALLESFASEHGARMISMQKATDNATELLKDLRLSYNKARQSAITNEIIEIVSGSSALSK